MYNVVNFMKSSKMHKTTLYALCVSGGIEIYILDVEKQAKERYTRSWLLEEGKGIDCGDFHCVYKHFIFKK